MLVRRKSDKTFQKLKLFWNSDIFVLFKVDFFQKSVGMKPVLKYCVSSINVSFQLFYKNLKKFII